MNTLSFNKDSVGRALRHCKNSLSLGKENIRFLFSHSLGNGGSKPCYRHSLGKENIRFLFSHSLGNKLVVFGVVVCLLLLVPIVVSAATSTSIWTGARCAPNGLGPTEPCGLCDAIVVVSNVFRFLIRLSIYAATIYVVYGGITMMISGGDETKYKEGKGIIKRVIIGLAWILGAWLLINTLFKFLVQDPNKAPWNTVQCVATVPARKTPNPSQ